MVWSISHLSYSTMSDACGSEAGSINIDHELIKKIGFLLTHTNADRTSCKNGFAKHQLDNGAVDSLHSHMKPCKFERMATYPAFGMYSPFPRGLDCLHPVQEEVPFWVFIANSEQASLDFFRLAACEWQLAFGIYSHPCNDLIMFSPSTSESFSRCQLLTLDSRLLTMSFPPARPSHSSSAGPGVPTNLARLQLLAPDLVVSRFPSCCWLPKKQDLRCKNAQRSSNERPDGASISGTVYCALSFQRRYPCLRLSASWPWAS